MRLSLGTEHKSEAALFSRMLYTFEQDPRTSALVTWAATNADTPEELHRLSVDFAMAQERAAKLPGTITYPSKAFFADRTHQQAGKRSNHGASG